MKQTRYRLIFTALAAVALLATGCSKSDIESDGGNTVTGKMVSVALPLDFAGTETTAQGAAAAPTTKAASSTIDGFTVSLGDGSGNTKTNAPATRTIAQALTNVWVLQFDSSGKNVSTNNTGALAADDHLTAPELQVGTGYTIYVVANGVASGLTISNPATLTEFESTMLHTTPVTDAATLPLAGKLTNVSVVDLGDGKGKLKLMDGSSAVTLTRIHAEVTLTVDFEVTDYTLTNAQLYNVPVGATYGWNRSTTTFPDNTVLASFGFTNTAEAGMASLTSTTDGTKTTYKWFTGDNRRGDVAGLTTQPDRNSTKAPTYSTFARVTLTNTTASIKIYYDIYLGSGSVTNFDLARNHTYTATAAIKGTAKFQEALVDEDDRVSGENVPDYKIYLTDDKADSPIIISPKSTELAGVIWGPLTAIPDVGDIFNGKANTDALMKLSNASEYLAAKHCRDTGAKWYLPAQAELMLIDIYRSAISAEEQMREIIFWSSTASSISTILRAQFPIGFVASSSIEPSRALGVRCVREGKATTWSYPKVEGNTIVSRDGAKGIKEVALLTEAQKKFLMNQTTAKENQYEHTHEYNKVSAKFEVEVSTNTPTTSTTWEGANDYCKAHTTVAGVDQAWRLPTLRELILIWTFKSKLTDANALATGAFWSSTDYPGLISTWVLDFSNGNVGNSTGEPYYVRCVRDL